MRYTLHLDTKHKKMTTTSSNLPLDLTFHSKIHFEKADKFIETYFNEEGKLYYLRGDSAWVTVKEGVISFSDDCFGETKYVEKYVLTPVEDLSEVVTVSFRFDQVLENGKMYLHYHSDKFTMPIVNLPSYWENIRLMHHIQNSSGNYARENIKFIGRLYIHLPD